MYSNNSTIQGVIELGKEFKMNSKDLHFKQILQNTKGENIIVNMNAVFEKYYELLLEYTSTVILTDEEYLKYRFQPKVLSRDLYGTQELYFLLLRLNHMVSVIEFDKRNLKVFDKKLITLLNEIMVLEGDNILDNDMYIVKKINE